MKTSISINPAYTAKERVSDLILREKNGGISTDEKSELDHYLILEHLFRLTKAKAYAFINKL